MKKILLILLFIIFPFGQLLRFDLPGTGVALQVNDFIVGLTVLVFIKNFKKDKLFWPVVVWILVMVLSILVNINRLNTSEIFVAFSYVVRWVAYAGLYFVLKGYDFKKYLRWGILAVAAIGIGQFIFMPDVTFLAVSNWDDHWYRLVSTFLDPGFTGAVLVIGMVMVYEKRLLRPPMAIGVLAMTYVAMVLTYSRASYLMYLVSFGVISWYKKSVKIFVVAAILLAVTIPLLPKSTGEGTKLNRENSIVARIENWKQSVSIWSKYPIFGVGYGAYNSVNGANINSHSKSGADSSLLLVLATTGIVGFVSYLGVLRAVWGMGRKNKIFMAVFLGVLVHSWFNNTLFYPWVMEIMWIILL